MLDLYTVFSDEHVDILQKQSAAYAFFADMHGLLNEPAAPIPVLRTNSKITLAADYIKAHCTQNMRLEDIAAACELSPSYLIRAFRQQYQMTPHAYLLDRRVEYCRHRIRQGVPMAEVALDAGFADQAHMQRIFRRIVAATPGQYRN